MIVIAIYCDLVYSVRKYKAQYGACLNAFICVKCFNFPIETENYSDEYRFIKTCYVSEGRLFRTFTSFKKETITRLAN